MMKTLHVVLLCVAVAVVFTCLGVSHTFLYMRSHELSLRLQDKDAMIQQGIYGGTLIHVTGSASPVVTPVPTPIPAQVITEIPIRTMTPAATPSPVPYEQGSEPGSRHVNGKMSIKGGIHGNE